MSKYTELKKEIDRLKRRCCCNEGGSDCCYEEITLTEAQTLVSEGTIVPNTLYKITGVHKNKDGYDIPVLYDDGTNSGITIYLTGLSTNEFSSEGWGEFYNPKYDRENYGSSDGDMYAFSITNGGSGYTNNSAAGTIGGSGTGMTVNIITDTGVVIDVQISSFGSGYLPEDEITIEDGDENATFIVAQGLNLYNIWDGDNPYAYNIPLYNTIGQKKIWGPYVWSNKIGGNGFPNNATDLGTVHWDKIVYNTADYNLVLDYIEYDFDNDWISRRRNTEATIDVSFPYNIAPVLNESSLHPISVAMWGLPYDGNNGTENVNVDNSYFEFVNFKGSYIRDTKFERNSYRGNGYIGLNSRLESCLVSNNSFQVYVYINRNSAQKNIILQNNSQQGNFVNSNYKIAIDNNSDQEDFLLMNRGCQYFVSLNNNSNQHDFVFINNSGQCHENYGTTLDNSTQSGFYFTNHCFQYDTYLSNSSVQSNFNLNNSAITEGSILDGVSQTDVKIDSLQYITPISYTGIQQNLEANHNELKFRFKVDFDGNAGTGAVGAVTIPSFGIPTDFFISEVKLESTGLAYGGGSYLTLGIEGDDISSGLNSPVGNLTAISATAIQFITTGLTYTKSTSNARILVLSVNTASVTAGSVYFEVILHKLTT